MSPKPLRPINLLSPEENVQKMWAQNQRQNEQTGLGSHNVARARPNIQNLFPIEKPKYLSATDDSLSQI